MSEPRVQFTNIGLAELLSAKNTGIKAEITHIAAGDKSYKPEVSQVALRAERQRETIVDFEELSPTQLRMAAKFAGELEYEVREIGFYLATGTLLAVYSAPNTLLTYKSKNSSWIQKFTLDISPLPTDSVTVVVGTENLNLMLAEEMASMATAQIDNMTRHIGLLFRFNALEESLKSPANSVRRLESPY